MEQAPLYTAINEAGFSVIEFSDHPGFFGSWYVVVKRGHKILRIVHEGRDSLLSFHRGAKENQWEEITRAESHTMNNQALIEQSKLWLLGART